MKRYVSTSFWDDEWVQTLDFTEKGMYLYLLTNPLTNIAGVYKLANRRIVFDTGLSDETVEKIMRKFEDAGKAYRHGEYVVLPSWPHHQKCQNLNIQRGINRILKTLEPEILSFLNDVGYKYPLGEFLSETDSSAEGVNAQLPDSVQQMEMTDEQKLFMKLWQTTKDKNGLCIFQVTATIENPRDWERFWQKSKPTAEQIERAFKNFADGVNSGAIARRFIPATPDRFVLKGGMNRFYDPVSKEKGESEKTEKDALSGKIQL